MADEIRWGILSTANIGRKVVAPALQSSRNGRVVAVASRDGSRAREYAAALDIPTSHGSYEALLADPQVDAVYVPLPNSLHRHWTEQALAAGKHVLCEKPLAADAQECIAMHEAAERADRLLMEAFMYRFHPRIERTIASVRSGALGQLRLVRSSFTFAVADPSNIRLQPELAGGALMDVGSYCVNVSRTLFGREPIAAQANARWTSSGVDGDLVGVLRFEGGGTAQFHCALDLPRQEFVEVVGEAGRLRLESAFLPGTGPTSIETTGRDGVVHTEHVPGADEYRLMAEHFADCVLRREQPRYGALEAAANMAAIEALLRSAKAGGAPQPIATEERE